MRLQKLVPLPQKSASYDPWRMGLRWFFEFFVDLGPKNDFHQFAKMILHYEVDVKFAQGGPSLNTDPKKCGPTLIKGPSLRGQAKGLRNSRAPLPRKAKGGYGTLRALLGGYV